VGFFKRAWSIIGPDTINVVRSFFISGQLLKEVNATSKYLIPKVSNPSHVQDFRPISCCTSIYKCIAKIFANRIRVLPDLIGLFQSAFIENRNISDNILYLKSFFTITIIKGALLGAV
jgi:hypothetical protein